MLLFALLQELVHLILKFLSEGVHLVLLLLHQLSLGCEDLFVPNLHVSLAFLFLNLVSSLLHLMRFLVVLLPRQILLNLTHVKQLCRLLELKREGLLEICSVLLKLLSMVCLELLQLLLILFLGFCEDAIPVFVEFLVLLDMGVLDFFLALLMLKHELLILHVEFLLLQLKDTVLGHLSLWERKSGQSEAPLVIAWAETIASE